MGPSGHSSLSSLLPFSPAERTHTTQEVARAPFFACFGVYGRHTEVMKDLTCLPSDMMGPPDLSCSNRLTLSHRQCSGPVGQGGLQRARVFPADLLFPLLVNHYATDVALERKSSFSPHPE